MSVKLQQYIPRYLETSPELLAIAETENKLFNLQLMPEEMKLILNQFIVLADKDGIKAFEEIVGIIANPVTESEDFRRQRLVNRFSTKPPFTIRFLRNRLDAIIGAGKYTLEMDYDTNTLILTAIADNQNWYDEILITIGKVKPVNIVFKNVPLLIDGVNISEEIAAKQIEWNYRLETTAKISDTTPLANLIDLGIVGRSEQMSVQAKLLNNLANYTVSDIATVLINDTYKITEFSIKQAEDNTVKMEYVLPLDSGIKTATNMKLLDKDGAVLTSKPVYFVVPKDILVLHNIPMKEGV